MRWLWMVLGEHCVTVDIDENDRVRNLPPQFIRSEGIHKNDFKQLMKTMTPEIHIEEKYFDDNPQY